MGLIGSLVVVGELDPLRRVGGVERGPASQQGLEAAAERVHPRRLPAQDRRADLQGVGGGRRQHRLIAREQLDAARRLVREVEAGAMVSRVQPVQVAIEVEDAGVVAAHRGAAAAEVERQGRLHGGDEVAGADVAFGGERGVVVPHLRDADRRRHGPARRAHRRAGIGQLRRGGHGGRQRQERRESYRRLAPTGDHGTTTVSPSTR